MITQTLTRCRTWLVSAAIILTLVGAFIARTAFARVAMNTIDPVAVAAANGRRVVVTGPVAVTAGERTEMRVTVTQRSTGAIAEGIVFFAGTGEIDQWEVTAATLGSARFEPGPATAVGLARSSVNGRATDAHQWLVNLMLVSE